LTAQNGHKCGNRIRISRKFTKTFYHLSPKMDIKLKKTKSDEKSQKIANKKPKIDKTFEK
jgi:hypothetical protein